MSKTVKGSFKIIKAHPGLSVFRIEISEEPKIQGTLYALDYIQMPERIVLELTNAHGLQKDREGN